MTPEQWIVGDDTGVSSVTIWSVMMGVTPRWSGTPMDADDFGRCVRLLDCFPGWRERLSEVSGVYPEWEGLIACWSELQGHFRAGDVQKVNLLIQGLTGAA